MGYLACRHHAVVACPTQAVFRSRTRPVFGSDPALVSEPVHGLEYGRIVDLTHVRLVPGRYGRALQVSNHGEVFLETVDQIAAHDLHMIEIELHADIGLRGVFDDGSSMLDVIEKIVRPVPTVDRLDQQLNFFGGSKIGGVHQIFEENAIGGRTLFGGNLAGKTMDRARAGCGRGGERKGEQRMPNLLPPWHGRESEFAFAAGWRVESENGEPISFDGRFHCGGRHVVGKLQLNGLEARGRSSVDSFKQRPFREKIAEVSGKTRHWWPSKIFNDLLRAEVSAYSLAPRPTQDHPENQCPPILLFMLRCCLETGWGPKSWRQRSKSCAGSRRPLRASLSVLPRALRGRVTTKKQASQCRIRPSSFARRPTPSCLVPVVCRACAIPTIPRSCRRSNYDLFSIFMLACDRRVSSPVCPARSLMRRRAA